MIFRMDAGNAWQIAGSAPRMLGIIDKAMAIYFVLVSLLVGRRVSAAMIDSELLYFTQRIDGRMYGGWFRKLSSEKIEVLAPGLMRTLALQGRPADVVATEALGEFVRGRLLEGAPVPALDDCV